MIIDRVRSICRSVGGHSSLNWLLILIPIGLGLDWSGAHPTLVFLCSALAIMPLAEQMGSATETLSRSLGPTYGGLLNATLNNAPEIIIAGFALHQGLVPIVKASITGSLVGNLLLGLGLSMLLGGVRNGPQRFSPTVAHLNSTLLMLAGIGLIVPAVFRFSVDSDRQISLEVSIVLFLAYLGSLVYVVLTSRSALGKEGVKAELREQGERPDESEEAGPKLSSGVAAGLLVATTLLLAVMSEVMTGAIEPTARSLGMTDVFAGVFLLALVSNIPQLYNAVGFARKDKMDLAIGVTVGASIQVALVVAPVLVFLGFALGQDMDLIFSRFELVAIIATAYIARNLILDGASNWLEGLVLIGVYLMFAIGFYYHPARPDDPAPPIAIERPGTSPLVPAPMP